MSYKFKLMSFQSNSKLNSFQEIAVGLLCFHFFDILFYIEVFSYINQIDQIKSTENYISKHIFIENMWKKYLINGVGLTEVYHFSKKWTISVVQTYTCNKKKICQVLIVLSHFSINRKRHTQRTRYLLSVSLLPMII